MADVKRIDLILWAKDLRSGEYKQVRNVLYDARQKGFCCLGVLLKTQLGYHEQTNTKVGCFLETADGDWISPLRDRGLIGSDIDELIRMNDGGASFAEIANHVVGLKLRDVK